MKIVPSAWMQPVKMRGIVAHWSGGTHAVSALDKEHYHIIVSGGGQVVKGDHDISDNVSTADDDYAAHTRACNTGFIGVSMACMGDTVFPSRVKENPFFAGPFAMTREQWDVCMKVIAELAAFYKIPVTDKTILSHAEVQKNLGIRQNGKWDFTRLAFDPGIKGAKACGDKMRAEVAALMQKAP